MMKPYLTTWLHSTKQQLVLQCLQTYLTRAAVWQVWLRETKTNTMYGRAIEHIEDVKEIEHIVQVQLMEQIEQWKLTALVRLTKQIEVIELIDLAELIKHVELVELIGN